MIHVITGAPCSGKSTYVKEHINPGDVSIDLDTLTTVLGNCEKYKASYEITSVALAAREAAIHEAIKLNCEAWIIDSRPTEEKRRIYEQAGAEFIAMDTDMETCLARCEADNRPEGTSEQIRAFFNASKGARKMIKTKTYEVKADNGTITGYASTWTREPDSYGDIVAQGAFKESIENIKAAGKVLPLLYNHDNDELKNFIGTVVELEEDDHGLKFTATFDDTPEAQRARELAMDGRLAKFSFAYDVEDQAEVELEDGRKANELRKLTIHEVSLVLYPANPDTSVVSVKNKEIIAKVQIEPTEELKDLLEKAGRRNSHKDEDAIREAISLLQGVLGELEDIAEEEEAKSEELDTVNDEERTRKALLLEHANKLLEV